MNANRMINMVIRMILRRVMRGGLPGPVSDKGESAPGPDGRKTARTARQALRLGRRIGRM